MAELLALNDKIQELQQLAEAHKTKLATSTKQMSCVQQETVQQSEEERLQKEIATLQSELELTIRDTKQK